MIQKFADWLVYDIFGLDVFNSFRRSRQLLLLRYDKDFDIIIFYQRDNGHYKCLFPDRTFAQLFDIS